MSVRLGSNEWVTSSSLMDQELMKRYPVLDVAGPSDGSRVTYAALRK